jgi:deoxyribodipyrimidine photo-lyase
MAEPLQTRFSDREALIAYLREIFPDSYDGHVSETRGGRPAAEERLKAANPARYAATRNLLDGDVTHLSAYLRHGVLSLREARVAVLRKAGRNAEKLINELAWRDYWQRVYQRIGDGIWVDREPYKTGWRASDYAAQLPPDLLAAETGLACIDGFVTALYATGYLHNHARMWLAAYIVHHRRVRWQAGAAWFLMHLLDGDPASNNLSWQWVASTFSAKPYFFDRGNLERNTHGDYCRDCPLARRGCPFDRPLEDLAGQLFPHVNPADIGLGADAGRSNPGSRKKGNVR